MTTPEDDVAVIEDTPTPARHASRTPDREREILLNVEALVKHFPIKGGFLSKSTSAVQAVDGIDFDVRRGETFSWVSPAAARAPRPD